MLLTKKKLRDYLFDEFKVSVHLAHLNTWITLPIYEVVEILDNKISRLEDKIKELEEKKDKDR